MSSDALASAAVGATNVLGTLVAASLMERAGRKQLMAGSFMGQVGARGGCKYQPKLNQNQRKRECRQRH